MTKDEKYISRCIQLAKNGLCNAAPNPMVGVGKRKERFWQISKTT